MAEVVQQKIYHTYELVENIYESLMSNNGLLSPREVAAVGVVRTSAPGEPRQLEAEARVEGIAESYDEEILYQKGGVYYFASGQDGEIDTQLVITPMTQYEHLWTIVDSILMKKFVLASLTKAVQSQSVAAKK